MEAGGSGLAVNLPGRFEAVHELSVEGKGEEVDIMSFSVRHRVRGMNLKNSPLPVVEKFKVRGRMGPGGPAENTITSAKSRRNIFFTVLTLLQS